MLSPGKQFSGMCYFFIVIMTMSADTASDLNLFSLEFVRLRHITSRQSVHKDDSQLLPACLT